MLTLNVHKLYKLHYCLGSLFDIKFIEKLLSNGFIIVYNDKSNNPIVEINLNQEYIYCEFSTFVDVKIIKIISKLIYIFSNSFDITFRYLRIVFIANLFEIYYTENDKWYYYFYSYIKLFYKNIFSFFEAWLQIAKYKS